MNRLLLEALACQNKGRPPIWLMRQAGRYMPEYQKIRKQHSLLKMFHDPELIEEVTLLPIDLLDVDAAILFADILSVLDGLGLSWDFHEGKGPVIQETVTPATVFVKKTDYAHTKKAITSLKRRLKVPLLGFAGAPFTVASYMIEGGSSKELKKTKRWAFHDPASFHALLEKITAATLEYLDVQVQAGVDAVQLFDSWAQMLSIKEFRLFCLPYMEKIIAHMKVPVILFCRGSSFFAKELARVKPSAISLDWGRSIAEVREEIPSTIALQGNLDPCVLLAGREAIRRECAPLLESQKGNPGYIFNLGHGIFPETPFEDVKFLVDYVRGAST